MLTLRIVPARDLESKACGINPTTLSSLDNTIEGLWYGQVYSGNGMVVDTVSELLV